MRNYLLKPNYSHCNVTLYTVCNNKWSKRVLTSTTVQSVLLCLLETYTITDHDVGPEPDLDKTFLCLLVQVSHCALHEALILKKVSSQREIIWDHSKQGNRKSEKRCQQGSTDNYLKIFRVRHRYSLDIPSNSRYNVDFISLYKIYPTVCNGWMNIFL
jgi:hypothetical protein